MGAPQFVLPVPPPNAMWNRLFVGYLLAKRPGITATLAEQFAVAAFSAMFLLTPHEAADWWDQATHRGQAASGHQMPPLED